jgi:hypothetical protein
MLPYHIKSFPPTVTEDSSVSYRLWASRSSTGNDRYQLDFSSINDSRSTLPHIRLRPLLL